MGSIYMINNNNNKTETTLTSNNNRDSSGGKKKNIFILCFYSWEPKNHSENAFNNHLIQKNTSKCVLIESRRKYLKNSIKANVKKKFKKIKVKIKIKHSWVVLPRNTITQRSPTTLSPTTKANAAMFLNTYSIRKATTKAKKKKKDNKNALNMRAQAQTQAQTKMWASSGSSNNHRKYSNKLRFQFECIVGSGAGVVA